jgi:hypothetical protein
MTTDMGHGVTLVRFTSLAMSLRQAQGTVTELTHLLIQRVQGDDVLCHRLAGGHLHWRNG